MGVIRQKFIRICFIVGIIIVLFTGCNNSSSTENELSKAKSVENATKESKETPPKTWPMEKYGDPEIFKTPRLQFSWKAPGDEERSLWSIRLDGSDLRRVLPYELLYRKGSNFNYTPLRSPDNRYIYITQGGGEWPMRNLIDLKEQTVTTLTSGGTVPHGTWSHDSKWLYFYSDLEFYRYDIEKKKLDKYKWIPSKGIHLLPNGNFFALHDTGFAIHAPDGEKAQFVKLGKKIHDNHALSYNGKRLMFHRNGIESTIINILSPEDILYKDNKSKYSSAFGPNSEYLYYANQRRLYRIDISKKESQEIFSVNYSYIMHISLVNFSKK